MPRPESFRRADADPICLDKAAVGFLAFLGVLAPSRNTKRMSVLLTCGLIVFAIVNLSAMTGISRQRLELQSLLLTGNGSFKAESYPRPEDLRAIRDTLRAPSVRSLQILHFAGDALLLVPIWLIPAIRRSELAREIEGAKAG